MVLSWKTKIKQKNLHLPPAFLYIYHLLINHLSITLSINHLSIIYLPSIFYLAIIYHYPSIIYCLCIIDPSSSSINHSPTVYYLSNCLPVIYHLFLSITYHPSLIVYVWVYHLSSVYLSIICHLVLCISVTLLPVQLSLICSIWICLSREKGRWRSCGRRKPQDFILSA